MARPLIKIDWGEFDKLCNLQCTLSEIAGWFECSEDTIERACKREKEEDFADYYKKKSQKGKISLRRKQMEIALNGNVGMLVWLGKQYLDQSDKTKVAPTNPDWKKPYEPGLTEQQRIELVKKLIQEYASRGPSPAGQGDPE